MIEVTELVFAYPGAKEPAVVWSSLSQTARCSDSWGRSAGKSTTQRVLTGLLRDYSGKVRVLEREVRDWGSSLYEQIGVALVHESQA